MIDDLKTSGKWKIHLTVKMRFMLSKYSVGKFLRYYATFKVRKLSNCSTKLIHVCKKLPLALDCRQSEYSQ